MHVVLSVHPSARRVLCGGVVLAALLVPFSALASPKKTHDKTATSSADAFRRAEALWQSGALDEAAVLYRAAVTHGGLESEQLYQSYVRIGVGLAAAGKKRDATEAFRRALELRHDLALPPEAGKKSADILREISRDKKHPVSSMVFSATVPDSIRVGERLHVEAQVDAPHAASVSAVAVTVDDGLAHRHEQAELPPIEGECLFDFPAALSLPSASLVVTITALDVHRNQLVRTERRVTVAAAPPAKSDTRAVVATLSTPPPSGSKSIWATPWPYVVGGTALLAGGAAAYFLTRPPSDVSVGGVRVELTH